VDCTAGELTVGTEELTVGPGEFPAVFGVPLFVVVEVHEGNLLVGGVCRNWWVMFIHVPSDRVSQNCAIVVGFFSMTSVGGLENDVPSDSSWLIGRRRENSFYFVTVDFTVEEHVIGAEFVSRVQMVMRYLAWAAAFGHFFDPRFVYGDHFIIGDSRDVENVVLDSDIGRGVRGLRFVLAPIGSSLGMRNYRCTFSIPAGPFRVVPWAGGHSKLVVPADVSSASLEFAVKRALTRCLIYQLDSQFVLTSESVTVLYDVRVKFEEDMYSLPLAGSTEYSRFGSLMRQVLPLHPDRLAGAFAGTASPSVVWGDVSWPRFEGGPRWGSWTPSSSSSANPPS